MILTLSLLYSIHCDQCKLPCIIILYYMYIHISDGVLAVSVLVVASVPLLPLILALCCIMRKTQLHEKGGQLYLF